MWDPVESKPPNIMVVGSRSGEDGVISHIIGGMGLNARVLPLSSCHSAMQTLMQKGPYEDWPLPDMILLFCDRTNPDALDLLASIRQLTEYSITPVIVFTTVQSPSTILQAYKFGANCVICKPASTHEFEDVCKKTLHFWLKIAEPPVQYK